MKAGMREGTKEGHKERQYTGRGLTKEVNKGGRAVGENNTKKEAKNEG